jgi:[ribosomal protein S18]-alanine N-acetyltransferase
MSYTIEKMSKSAAQEIAKWRYTGREAFYNPDGISTWDYVAWLLEPNYRYYMLYEGEMLVGFCCYGVDAQVPGGDYSLRATLDVGLGMHPELTGQGRGQAFLTAILVFAAEQFHVQQFRATIATFNQRSQRLFLRAGFQPVQRFLSGYDQTTEFVIMVKQPYS